MYNKGLNKHTSFELIKHICVFGVTGMKILGKAHTFFSEKKNYAIFERQIKGKLPFKMHKVIYFNRKT